jgi:hypothetical protein
MVEYRQNASSEATAGPSSQPRPAAARRAPSGFTKLADKYLSLDDMRISDSSSLQTQTIEQEFQAYITAPVCAEGTDIVKYWEVRHCVDE